VVGDGADEGSHGVNGEEEEHADAEKPEAEAKSVAAAMCEENDEGPEEIELLFHGEGPEMVEGEGRGGFERVAGEVRKILKEADKDEKWAELGETGSGGEGGDGDGEQGKGVEGKDAEGASGVKV
jgi:hypothetical protein